MCITALDIGCWLGFGIGQDGDAIDILAPHGTVTIEDGGKGAGTVLTGGRFGASRDVVEIALELVIAVGLEVSLGGEVDGAIICVEGEPIDIFTPRGEADIGAIEVEGPGTRCGLTPTGGCEGKDILITGGDTRNPGGPQRRDEQVASGAEADTIDIFATGRELNIGAIEDE